jgi:putative tricarboxylic transport membrane protein
MDIPTAKEQKIDVEWSQFWGLAGAPGMDPTLVKWWNDRLEKLVATKAWKDSVEANFQRSDFVDHTKAADYMARQYQRYLQVLRDLGLSKQ